jgi:methyltransferase (TIGR00027 family)
MVGQMPGPDLTAIGAAFGRAAHVLLDKPPFVFEDSLSIKLPEDEVLRAANLLGPDGSLIVAKDDSRVWWRTAFVARARFVEDLVIEHLENGVSQYAILGAGLDTFAQRRREVMPRLRLFEIDEPDTQQWKQRRLRELAIPTAPNHKFVAVDFESGQSWITALAATGFNPGEPSVVASTGVAQYITIDAMTDTFRQAAGLARGTVFISTFVPPVDLIDPSERHYRALTEQGAAARGHPWISFYTPGEFISIASEAGFDNVHHVTADELNARYFENRTDGLRAKSGENLIVASTSW